MPYRLLLGEVTRGAQDDDDGVVLEFNGAAGDARSAVCIFISLKLCWAVIYFFFSPFTPICRAHPRRDALQPSRSSCAGGGKLARRNPAVGVVGTSDVTNAGADSPRILAFLGLNDVVGHDDSERHSEPGNEKKKRERENGGEGSRRERRLLGTEGSVY